MQAARLNALGYVWIEVGTTLLVRFILSDPVIGLLAGLDRLSRLGDVFLHLGGRRENGGSPRLVLEGERPNVLLCEDSGRREGEGSNEKQGPRDHHLNPQMNGS